MFQQRLEKLRQTIKEKNIESILISNFFNILYLSGFKTLTENEREAWLLVTHNNCYLFSDARYLEPNSKNTSTIKNKLITPKKGLIQHLIEIFKEEGVKSCGVEADDLKVIEFQQFIKYFKETRFIPTEKLVIRQRDIKDENEIKKIKKACEISDQCLKETLYLIKVGKTEKEIAFKMEFWLKEKGYDLAFYPIVAIDENSVLAHYDTKVRGDKKVKDGSIILIDFGAKFENYLSDITRMVFVGKPENEAINTYHSLLDAQAKTINETKANAEGKQIDSFCRQLIIDKQLPNYQHSTGHGVGLEIHEYPKISPTSVDRLLENQIVTIEPGVYINNKWGMRIEDTVLVEKNGVEVLTKFNKQPTVIKD